MDDFYLDFISALNVSGVKYMVVGGFAVNFHGYNRATADLDLWLSNDEGNLVRLGDALSRLGYEFPSEAEAELKEDRIVSITEGEYVVELMTRLNISTEISFDQAYEFAEEREVNQVKVKLISFEHLKNEKARSKRYKDLDDLSKLEEAEAYYARKSKEE
ncbi:nucleotidyltransferase [Roseivirga pacifica]|uniref:nucleotidyltransferase n=1 Tax=Roseivirga pacifica TaxID=1267423 RepID=UPI00227ABFDA|nr:nucleotidyltransferase [Roseivirga pacifica]